MNRMRRAGAAFVALVVFAGLAACDRAPASLDDAVLVAAGAAHSPTVAVTTDGTALVAWVSGDSVHDVLLARAGEAPVRVNDIDGDAAPHTQAPAQVAVGPEGNIYVAWQNNTPVEGRRFPASDLRFARSTDGGRTFQAAIYVNDDAGGVPASHTFHDMAVSNDGTVYISWIDGRARAQAQDGAHAGAAMPDDGAHAGAAMHEDGALAGAAMHDGAHAGAAMHEDGAHAGAAMHEHGSSEPAASDAGPQIRVARSRDAGRSFEPGVIVASNSCPCCRTSIAVAGADVYVAWRDNDENIRNIVVAHSADGGETWGAPRAVHDDQWRIDGCPHAGPALAIAEDGRLHVAWYTGAPERPGIYHVVADAGFAFSAPAPLLSGEWVPPSLVDLAAAGGSMFATWDDRRSELPRVSFGPMGAATAAGFVSTAKRRTEAVGLAPALAANGAHYALAWLRGDSVFVSVGGVH